MRTMDVLEVVQLVAWWAQAHLLTAVIRLRVAGACWQPFGEGMEFFRAMPLLELDE